MILLIADSSKKTCDEIEGFCANYPEIQCRKSLQNGKDVLETICSNTIDVLLMDIVLPELDGLSILNHLHRMPGAHKPSVFIHTAFLDTRVLQELQRLDVIYCFVKPMRPEHIIPRVLQLMRRTDDAETNMPIQVDHSLLDDEFNALITREIRAIGIPAHLRGYHYLRSAIQYSVDAKDPSMIAVTKDIYPAIAKQYNTRPALVERSIRNAIEIAWTRGNTKILNQYFGYTIDDCKGKPTNAEFIAMIADRVRMLK